MVATPLGFFGASVTSVILRFRVEATQVDGRRTTGLPVDDAETGRYSDKNQSTGGRHRPSLPDNSNLMGCKKEMGASTGQKIVQSGPFFVKVRSGKLEL